MFYQSFIKINNNKNDFIILKNNKYNEVSNSLKDINEEENFYIKNNELHLIFKYIHIIMTLTCNIMDSIFLQNIVNIKLI